MSIVIGAPHIHSGESVRKIMWSVVIALMPAMIASFYFFGSDAMLVTITAVISCIIVEFLISRFLLKNKDMTVTDGSAVITGEPAVFQVMPLCVTGLPPSSLTLPPLAAEIAVIAEALVVVTVGSIAASVVKVRSAP